MDYKNGKIYRLVSNVSGKQYIGSTTQTLTKRKSKHYNNYKDWKEGKRRYITSFELFEAGEVEVVLVEDFPCERKEQLHARERHWIETTECVNKCIPTRTHSEYLKQWSYANYEKLTEQKKEYYQTNREQILEKHKEYYQTNKEVIAEKAKEYREANKETIADKKKEYREANKEKEYERVRTWATKKVTCECGKVVMQGNLNKHKGRKFHQEWQAHQNS